MACGRQPRARSAEMTNPPALAPCCEAIINNFPNCKQRQLLNWHSPLLPLLPLNFQSFISVPSPLPGPTHRAGLCQEGREGYLCTNLALGQRKVPGHSAAPDVGQKPPGYHPPYFWFLSLLFWYPISLATTESSNYANPNYPEYFKFLLY